MSNKNRDDFNINTKETLAKRVAYMCSNPNCRQFTVGPNQDETKPTITGVAAHIKAAAPGGPRYDCNMTSKERSSISNGIWLCCTCSTIIDKNPEKYPVTLLYEWKRGAEKHAESLQTNSKSNTNIQSKIQYPPVTNYINRKIILRDDNNVNEYYFSDKSTTPLKAIQENNLVVLLADAGSGKSFLLQQLVYQLSINENNLYPALIQLYNYTDKAIEDIIPREYKGILNSEKVLTFIFDGYDEIQEKDANDFIRRLNRFTSAYPDVKIILSSRTNFFKNTKLKDAKCFDIVPLSGDDISNYIAKNNIEAEEFYKAVNANDLRELLKLPFYLNATVNLFLGNKALPKKTQLMDKLIEQSFNFDSNHYNTTKDIEDEKALLFSSLEKVGFSINCLGKKYLTEDEYQKLINDKNERDLLKYSGIWKKNSNGNWQYLHNNFGEYLTAKLVYKKSLEEIISLITFNDRKSVKPSWVNALSYITSLYNGDDLKNWLSENSPELLIKFEKDRFPNKKRTEIFKLVYNSYSEKATWIDYDVMKDLIVFGESRRTLMFLLDEIKTPKNIQALKNSLELLIGFNNTFNQTIQINSVLLPYIFNDNNDEFVINRAILVLSNLKLQTKGLTDNLVKKFKNNKKSYIRYGMYVYLHTSEFLNENIDFFINGLKYHFENTNKEDSRIVNEYFELLKGISKISTIEAFEKVIKYIISFNNKIPIYSIEELTKTTLKLGEKLYSKNKDFIFTKVYSLLLSIYKKQGRINNEFITFFQNTNAKEAVFERLAKDNDFKYKYDIHNFYYDGCYKKIISMYKNGEITDETAINYTCRMNQDTTEFEELTKLIKKSTGEVIERRECVDYDLLRKKGTQKYFNALFDKAEFQKIINEIIKISSSEKLTTEDAIHLNYDFCNKRKDLYLTIWAIYHGFDNKNMLLSDFSIKVNWEYFSIYQIYEQLSIENNKIEISIEQKQYIQNYFYKKITTINFSKAITFKNDGVSIILFFMTYFDFGCDESILLNMLIYPFETNIEKQSYFDYIGQRVNLGKMKKCVIENIANNNLMGTVMEEHIKFCIKHSIYDVKDTIIKVCVNYERDEFLKRVAIDYLIMLLIDDMMDKSDFYQNVVAKLDEKSLFYVAEKLYKENDNELISILEEKTKTTESKDNKETLMAYLIKMNSDVGIKYYIKLLKSTNKTPTDFSRGEEMTKAIGMINDLNKLSYITELISIRFSDSFKDCSFQSLYSSLSDCLYLLGIQNNDSYEKVNEELKKILDRTDNNSKSKNEIHKIAFLNSTLEKIQNKYLSTNERILSINDVKKLLANVK